MTTVTLLRGRVAIRPDESGVSAVLWTPSQRNPLDRSGARTGVVVAMGPPALTKSHWWHCPDPECDDYDAGLGAELGSRWDGDVEVCQTCKGWPHRWLDGVEGPVDFAVGDRVIYLFGQIDTPLPGESVTEWCAQNEILGVVEP